jgi:DNA-binding NarL/FixJ family response regulator
MEIIEVTPREAEVLKFIAKGFSRYDIAEELYCSDTTIRRDCESLYAKFGVYKLKELKDKYKNESIELIIIAPTKNECQRKHRRLNNSIKNIHKLAKELCC